MREIDIKKKQSDSDFIKSLPNQPGKEFKIKKRLDALRGINGNNFNNNSNNLGGGGGTNFQNYGLDQPPPSLPRIEDFIEDGIPPPPPLPPEGGGGQNIFFNNNISRPPPQDNFNIFNTVPFVLPNIDNNGKIGNDLFGSVGAMAGPRAAPPEKPRQGIDDFLY